MTEILSFMGANPWLAWGLAWAIWPIGWTLQAILTAPFSYAFRAYNRHLRAKNIALHGWPTNSLMDADGDIVFPTVEKSK